MAEAPPPPPRRRRRRWPLVAAAALLALMGRGLGWLGSAPEERAGDDVVDAGDVRGDSAPPAVGDRDAAVPAPGADADSPPDGAALGLAAAGSEAVRERAPAASPDVVEPSAADAGPAPAPGGDAAARAPLGDDRFESLISLVRLRQEEGAFGAARESLAHVVAQPVSPSQRAALDTLAAELDAAVGAAGAALVAQLRRGEVLAANEAVARWFGGDGARGVALGDAVPDVGIGGDWRRAATIGDGLLPAATPLAKDLPVRVRWRDELRQGAVAASRADRVTVRIRTAAGQQFPTVPRVDCEPLDVRPADAVEMALACVHADRPLLARLWLAAAHLLADGELGERGERLRAALR